VGAEGLKASTRLTYLDISFNKLGHVGVEAIEDAVVLCMCARAWAWAWAWAVKLPNATSSPGAAKVVRESHGMWTSPPILHPPPS